MSNTASRTWRSRALNFGLLDVDSYTLDSTASRETSESVPVWGLLLEGNGHHVLFDTGCSKKNDADGRFHWDGPEHNPEELLLAQLALCGLPPADIDTVILSHMHDDHFGGVHLFPHAEIWYPAEENDEWHFEHGHPLCRGEEPEILPGIRILSLPGHTPNLLGLLTDDGIEKRLYPSDSVYSPRNYESFPGACHDRDAYDSSRKRVKAMEESGIPVYFAHWDKQFARMTKAPKDLTVLPDSVFMSL